MKCKHCKFFVKWQFDSGHCHRRSPKPIEKGEGIYHSVNPGWPLVSGYDFCGDFERAPVNPKKLNVEVKFNDADQ